MNEENDRPVIPQADGDGGPLESEITGRVRMLESRPDEWYDLVFTKDRTYIVGPKEHVEKALRRMVEEESP